MIEQLLVLVLALLTGGDQVPDEALDLIVTFVVLQAINQQSPEGKKKTCNTMLS